MARIQIIKRIVTHANCFSVPGGFPWNGSKISQHPYLRKRIGLLRADNREIISISHRSLASNNEPINREKNETPWKNTTLVSSLLLFAGGITYLEFRRVNTNKKYTVETLQQKIPDKLIEDNKEYTLKEVSFHNNLDKGVWIIYNDSVYDITDFIKHHPGGSHTILMGAGSDVGPFWETYPFHKKDEVQSLLAKYKIGLVKNDDLKEKKTQIQQDSSFNPYSDEPRRSELLTVLSKEPFNAETPPELLTQSYITPVDIFFVRNHMPVPEVVLQDYSLEIYMEDEKMQDNDKLLAKFTLDELKSKFKPCTIDAVVQCSGNRRTDLKKVKEIKGLDWKVGAIGNASWTGVRLVDLLDYLNIRNNTESIDKIKHVQLEGLDCDMSGQSYGASVTADVAFNPMMDVILAYEMNGQPLTRDHGFPLRFIAPGVAGARCVKWLKKIVFSSEESHSHWQRNDYKTFSPNIDMFNVQYDKAISIQEMPVQSAICQPSNGQTVVLQKSSGKTVSLDAHGYAYSGGGKNIVRVDVSTDNGTTWITANISADPNRTDARKVLEKRNRTWSWCRWSVEIPVNESIVKNGYGEMTILCRAFDSASNSQPERAETVWNLRGVVNNSWHRVNINVKLE